ncbi:MAG: PD40 domain-containing protein [Victivallales bacterium]|nr:PD40 domain-containing protein [Victivallales bacterium]
MNFDAFPAYTCFSPKVPVCCVTPGHRGAIHRFFDTSPVSPDGRYLAACVMPQETRLPLPGEKAAILVVDLETGEERIVAETAGWGVQVGANLQWLNEETLLFNDVDSTGADACLVRLDWRIGRSVRMGKGIFMLSPDGKYALTHNLARSRLSQVGYGVMVPDELLRPNNSHPEDDGFFRTNVHTGECTLFMPLARLLDEGLESLRTYEGGAFYGFQCKWSPDGKRILYVVRWHRQKEKRAMVFTSNSDGSNIHLALNYREWAKGGHHVNWHPDCEHITMNLIFNSDHLRFVSFRYDGTGLHPLLETLYGSGHPTVYRDGSHILTDAYTHDVCAYPDGSAPIRWVNLRTGTELELVRMPIRTGLESNLRLDPHPAWCHDWKHIVFNGFHEGTRRVYLADLSAILPPSL